MVVVVLEALVMREEGGSRGVGGSGGGVDEDYTLND